LTTDSADVLFHLAKAWQLRGNVEAAIAGFQRVLRLDPAYVPAYVELGGLMLRRGRAREALDYYEQALARGEASEAIRFRYSYVKSLVDDAARAPRVADAPHVLPAVPLRDNPWGKIDLRDQVSFKAHRSGWAYALEALMPLHNRRGVLFDGFIERNFAWKHWMDGIRPPDVLERLKCEGTFDELATSEERGITPYTRPWIGLLHNPQAMPTWFHYQESPQTIFGKAIWEKSMDSCVGLFTLSEYHGRWVRQRTGKPVSVLTFPTEIPDRQFDFDRFTTNRHKKVVQIGWWLRKLNAIYQLPIPHSNPLGYEKIRLVPRFFGNADHYLTQLMAQEAAHYDVATDPAFSSNTREIQHLPDAEYDRLLAENIVFVDLYDTSANNAVVECIARATPILVNPLPAVVEYLGEDYPLYFNGLSEAADKALDTSLVHAAHVYLKNCATRQRLSGDHFRRSFEESDVYRLI
jgi:hypothetical protein